jgi:hypothetical protein
MSEDQFTEVTSQSWFGRIGNAIKGIVVGLILFVISFPVLFWNEGRAVKTYQSLREGGKVVVSIAADRVDPANAGKLVHLTGKAETAETLKDPVFGVSAKALKLKSVVEMYQWEETKSSSTHKKLGGGSETVTTYKYNRVWSERLNDSSAFKQPAEHQNPATMPYQTTEWVAQSVKLGAFELSAPLVGKITNYTPLAVSDGTPIPAMVQGKAKVSGGGFYIGSDPASPKLGDVRVTFKTVNPAEVSVIARQINNTFEPYQAKAGRAIELLQMGTMSAESMFQTAQRENQILTWILRAVGFVLMAVGLGLILNPLSVIADLIPFVGSLVSIGTGTLAFLAAFMLTLVTVAIAWIAYRPVLGVGLIVVAVGAMLLIRKKIQQKRQARIGAGAS